MAEDEDVEIRIGGLTTHFTSRRRTGLVDYAQPKALDLRAGELGEALTQDAMVVVADDSHEPTGSRLQSIEQCHSHPVARVDDEVGFVDGAPQLTRQVLGALRYVGVGQQEQSGGHAAKSTVVGRVARSSRHPRDETMRSATAACSLAKVEGLRPIQVGALTLIHWSAEHTSWPWLACHTSTYSTCFWAAASRSAQLRPPLP